MIKNKDQQPKVKVSGNGQDPDIEAIIATAIAQAMQPIVVQQQALQQEVSERFGELEDKKHVDTAQIIAAKLAYDTPREKKRAFSNIHQRMVDPLSLADTCAAILSPEVQNGEVSLPSIRRESIYDHLKSVKGLNLQNCSRLAEQQEQNQPEAGLEARELGG